MIRDGWYLCPECRQKLVKAEHGAKSEKVYIKCKQCRKVVEIKIEKESLSHEHEPKQNSI